MAQSREEKLAKKKEYSLANKEKQSQQNRERYQRKKEQAQAAGLDIREMRRAYYAEHRDVLLARRRAWVAAELGHPAQDKTRTIAHRFGVSITAMRIRLRQLGFGSPSR